MLDAVLGMSITLMLILVAHVFLGIWDREGVNKDTLMRIFCTSQLCPSAASLKEGKKGGVASQINKATFFYCSYTGKNP